MTIGYYPSRRAAQALAEIRRRRRRGGSGRAGVREQLGDLVEQDGGARHPHPVVRDQHRPHLRAVLGFALRGP